MIPLCQHCHGNRGFYIAPNGDHYLSDPEDGKEYKWVGCEKCDASGFDTNWIKCPDCDGMGNTLIHPAGVPFSQTLAEMVDCPKCNGSGQVRKVKS